MMCLGSLTLLIPRLSAQPLPKLDAAVHLDSSAALVYSNTIRSYQHAEAAVKLYSKAGDKLNKAKAQLRASYVLLQLGDIDLADELLEEAIPVFMDSRAFSSLAHAYATKSNILGRVDEVERSTEYLYKAIEYARKDPNKTNLVRYLQNLAVRYIYTINEPDTAAVTSLLKEAEELIRGDSKADLEDKIVLLALKARVQFLAGNLNDAVMLYAESYALSLEENIPDKQTTMLMRLGEVYLKMRRFDEALQSVNSSLRVAQENDYPYEEMEAWEVLYQIYETQGADGKALEAYKRKTHLNDSLHAVEKANKVNAMERRLQLAELQKSQEKLLLEADNERKLRESADAKSLLLTGGIALALVLVLVILFSLVRANRLNKKVKNQHRLLQKQQSQLEEAYKDLTDSVRYSKRMQDALLPEKQWLEQYLGDTGLIYLPRDIVSGDFYWITQASDGTIYLAVGDCTGHGVPGAMLSLLAMNTLNRIFAGFDKQPSPALLLDHLNTEITKAFSQSTMHINDGLDIGIIQLCNSGKVIFSGANISLLSYAANHPVKRFPGDKQPIGPYMFTKPFTEVTLENLSGHYICLSSDGFADQFGIPTNRQKPLKLKWSGMYKWLDSVTHLSPSAQALELKNRLTQFQGDVMQMDDVCVVVFKVP